jgi:PKD repeat protein
MRLFDIAQRLRRRRRTRGQSLVEFAILLPIMLVLLAAVLDLGRVFYATISLNNAAREGAFQAAQTPESFQSGQPCSTATNLVVCRVQLESKGSAVEVADDEITLSCSISGCPEQAGSTVTVGVTGEFQLITPILSFVFGGQTIPMSASATAQREYLPTPALTTLPPPPVAEFTWSVSGKTVSFDGGPSSGNPTGWSWDFGDGNFDNTSGETTTHTYASNGTYVVKLTVVNLAGEDSGTHSINVGSPSPSPTGSSAPTASPSPSPTPFNCYPPNVIGKSPATAQALLINAGFSVITYADLTNGPKNKVQAQNPDHTQCLAAGTQISIHYRPS